MGLSTAANISATSSAMAAKCCSLAAFGGQGGELALKNEARLEHLPGLKTVQRAHQAERGLAKLGRAVGDEGADAVADLHHTHGSEIADAGAQAGAADLERPGELALRRNFVARLQGPVLDEGTDVVNHPHGPWVSDFFISPCGISETPSCNV